MLSCVITILIVFYDIFICRVSLVIITYLNPLSSYIFDARIEAGQTVTFKKAYVNKSKKQFAYYVTCEGQSGWIEPFTTSGPHWGTYFEEKQLAG